MLSSDAWRRTLQGESEELSTTRGADLGVSGLSLDMIKKRPDEYTGGTCSAVDLPALTSSLKQGGWT